MHLADRVANYGKIVLSLLQYSLCHNNTMGGGGEYYDKCVNEKNETRLWGGHE